MSKIGIITILKVNNYGAELQAYATQAILNANGYDAEIIDYLFYKNPLHIRTPKSKPTFKFGFKKVLAEWGYPIKNYIASAFSKGNDATRKKRFEMFHTDNTKMSDCYRSIDELYKADLKYDTYVVGSDQVWNSSYVLHGEGGPTPVYFLNFGAPKCKKVALSVSFGCTEYPEKALEIVKPYVLKFDNISVRENTGLNIMERFGFDGAIVTADPSSLITREHYLSLCGNCKKPAQYTAICFLRKKQKYVAKSIKKIIKRIGNPILNIERESMQDWLLGIRDAEMVVTDSFHCVMMCLKLHTPFVVIKASGGSSGMNDRLYTLLEQFGLTHRICSSCDEVDVFEKFDWTKVDVDMEKYSLSLKDYLAKIVD